MIKKTLFVIVIILVGIQFIPINKSNPIVDQNLSLHTDPQVMNILKKSCYDCHSNETKYSIYADIAPLSFGIESHISDARKALNFSIYKEIPDDIKRARLQRAIKTIKNGMMPLSSYLMFHDEAKMSKEEKQVLLKWFEDELERLDKHLSS